MASKNEFDKNSDSDKQEEEDKVNEMQDNSGGDQNTRQLQLYKPDDKDDTLQSDKEQLIKADLSPQNYELSQASDHMVRSLDDLFNIFDSFQNALYSGEAQAAIKDDKEGIDEDKAIYEESILITILGDNYMDFIDSATGEWVNERSILEHFGKIFTDEVENMLRGNKQQV